VAATISQEVDSAVRATLALAHAGVPLDAINRLRAHAAAARRGEDTDAPEHDDDRRARFLRGLLEGTLPRAEAQDRAAAYGLLPGGRYMALRGLARGDSRRLVHAVERSGRTESGGALAAFVEGDVWGLVARQPELDPEQGVVALGPPLELGEAHASFEAAGRVLETATAFRLAGVVTVDDLSLRPVVLAEHALGERLVRRYLEPLRDLGEFGATLEHTVDAFLARGMHIDESARALIIHPNTLRHRLDRFQQLTGADLRRTEDVVEVWWALQRRKASGQT
jgi:hypothetical protein